jgi:6-phosphogluconolactonase
MSFVNVFPDSEAMALEIARQWYYGAHKASQKKNVFTIVLSGGATASKVYRKIGSSQWNDKMPWEVIHIFWADERCVPPKHEESNYFNIQRAFLENLPIPAENIHRICGETEPFSEAARYEKEILDHLALRNDAHKLFDWVLLGVGSDGHTASLFPGNEYLLDSPNICAVVEHPATGQKRITLTPYAINRSARVTYHVVGQDKATIVSDLIPKSELKRFPTGHIEGEWFLDRAAGSLLSSTSLG